MSTYVKMHSNTFVKIGDYRINMNDISKYEGDGQWLFITFKNGGCFKHYFGFKAEYERVLSTLDHYLMATVPNLSRDE